MKPNSAVSSTNTSDANRKPVGIGSLSFVIFIIAIIFSFSTKSKAAMGDYVFTLIGLKAWSNGTNGFHYTIIGSIALLFIAWLIGSKYKNHFGAALGKKWSLWLGIILIAMTLGSI